MSAPAARVPAVRHEGLDGLRGVLLLYVIAFWHGLGFSPYAGWHVNAVTAQVTTIVLATFLLLSGYFVGIGWERLGRANLTTWQRSRRLVGDRLRKLYPLYLIALILFLVVGLTTPVEMIKAVLLVSSVLKPAPETLWFVLALLTMIVISPLMLAAVARVDRFVLRVVVIFAIAVAYALTTRLLDTRIVMYLPSFALGLLLGQRGVMRLDRKWTLALLVLTIVGCLFAVMEQRHSSQMFEIARSVAIAFPMSALLFALAALFPRLGPAAGPVDFLAFAGYAAYLFHRPIYMLLIGAYLPEGPALQAAYILFVCVPIIFVVATIIQRLFDQVFIRVAGRSKRAVVAAGAKE